MGLRSQNNPIASFRDVFSTTGKDAMGAAPAAGGGGLTATGGIISDYVVGSEVYRAHVFTSSGTFAVTAPGSFGDNVDVFAIGGGGGGGAYTGAGGGGGGAFAVTSYPVAVASYSITIGAGGVAPPSNTVAGLRGGDTVFTDPSSNPNLTAVGGGGGMAGGSPHPKIQNNGGSGGGGNSNGRGNVLQPSQNPGVSNLTNFGQSGGDGVGPGQGGGGGAGADGGHGSPNVGGNGGAGTPNVYAYGSGTPVTYGGGGGGGRNGGGQSSGGSGGGGKSRGPSNSDTVGHADFSGGEFAKGGGGGGADNNGAPLAGNRGGHGGSGTCIVRYQIAQLTATAKATGGAISYYDGKTIHTFTSSGTFTVPGTFNETIRYAAIGGGGGGGVQHGGGGGAGGYRTADIPLNAAGSTVNVSVVIGAGGAGMSPKGSLAGTAGGENNGNDTVVSFPSPVTAGKGGGGAQLGPPSGSPAGVGASVPLGSGGGGGMHQPGNSSWPIFRF